uniref:Uncharacterized protein n=1 Tax=Romanomermis culicivorax TaxID=13658 RepID=A0A915I9Y8_ROMCU
MTDSMIGVQGLLEKFILDQRQKDIRSGIPPFARNYCAHTDQVKAGQPQGHQNNQYFLTDDYNIKCLVRILEIEQWFASTMGYWLQRPMEPEWVHIGNVEPVLKQMATSQFRGLGVVGFDVKKIKKAEPQEWDLLISFLSSVDHFWVGFKVVEDLVVILNVYGSRSGASAHDKKKIIQACILQGFGKYWDCEICIRMMTGPMANHTRDLGLCLENLGLKGLFTEFYLADVGKYQCDFGDKKV